MKKVFLSSRPGHQSKRPPAASSKESAYKAVTASIIVAIATAAIGYTVSFVAAHRKVEIEKVDKQIEKLYGPLYAYDTASTRAWKDLLHVSGRGEAHSYFDDQDMPTAEQVELWRRWMKAVFMPINLKTEAAIIDNAQLLDGSKIYPCFEKLISHVESYKATLASWKDEDDLTQTKHRASKANVAVINYPRGLDDCIENRLQASLKRRNEIERSWTGLFLTEAEMNVPKSCHC